jgi:hypothetical protein
VFTFGVSRGLAGSRGVAGFHAGSEVNLRNISTTCGLITNKYVDVYILYQHQKNVRVREHIHTQIDSRYAINVIYII